MENTKKLLEDKAYLDYLNRLEAFEKDRIFCRHNLEHFLDVARICYINSLEKNLGLSKDIIYFTALLHDIGRVEEYENNTDHNKASRTIASGFLENTSFSKMEKDFILAAISNHSSSHKNSFEGELTSLSEVEKTFVNIFRQADGLSRNCFRCPAYDKCYWSQERKNRTIKY